MLNHNQIQRDQTRLRLLALLAKNGKLSWSQLLMSTKLNKNTISNQLAELRRGGWIEESIGRTGNRGRPQLFYSICSDKREKVRHLLKPVKGVLEIEDEYESFFSNYTRGVDPNSSKPIQSDILDALTKAALAMLQTVILQREAYPGKSTITEFEAVSAVGRILELALSFRKLPLGEKNKVRRDLENNRKQMANLAAKYIYVPVESRKGKKVPKDSNRREDCKEVES